MSSPNQKPVLVPVTSVVALTQTAIGCGIGLLLANRLKNGARKVTGWTMLSVGLASVAPVIVNYFARTANAPTSRRALRRRLDSIRHDSGFSENADVF